MIAIIDYDAGNLKSVEKALAHIGEESVITREFQTILNADKVILPGVGAFGDAMANLKRLELDKVIRELNEKQTPCGRSWSVERKNQPDSRQRRTENSAYRLEFPGFS